MLIINFMSLSKPCFMNTLKRNNSFFLDGIHTGIFDSGCGHHIVCN